jgi:prepilin-type processing-associated H-X9-DG protein
MWRVALRRNLCMDLVVPLGQRWRKMNTNKKSFSLIELLVVVAVIIILAAMLIPAVLQAQEKARVAKCAANLRALHTAAFAFRLDNGALPKGAGANAWVTTINTNSSWRVGWSGTVAVASVTATPQGSLYKYVGSIQPYACPTVKRLFRGAVRTYGLNMHLSGDSMSDKSFARTVLFVEQGLYTDPGIESSGRASGFNSWWSLLQTAGACPAVNDPGGNGPYDRACDGEFSDTTFLPYSGFPGLWEHIGAYHTGKGNVIFADGHIEMVSFIHTNFVAYTNFVVGIANGINDKIQ